MLTLVLLLAPSADPQTFQVTNRCEGKSRFVVTNRCQVPTSPPAIRVASGHTHTCANGHTWDHSINPTHNCQVCGLPQYVQDPFPRPVMSYSASPSYYPLPSFSSGGCANGSCSTGVVRRR